MKLSGTYTWFGYLEPFEDKLRAIRDAGFKTICTFWTPEMEDSDGPRAGQQETADRYGLYLEHAHLGYYRANLLWEDTMDGSSVREGYIEDIRLAAKGDVNTLVIHPCEIYPPDMNRYDIFRDNMKRISDVCADTGVRLAVENLGENTTVRKIINDLKDNPNVGLCFDSGHNNVAAGDYFDLLDEFRDRIFATHIHDNNGIKDLHLLPYHEGCCLNWKHFIDVADKTGFEGSLMLEACYPLDYDKFTGENDEEWAVPPYPMEEWLKEAKTACDRIYSERNALLSGDCK